jgi:SAM-dependent methyltransferase
MRLFPTYSRLPDGPVPYDFLQVDQFLKTGTAAAALSAGLTLGVIDRLCAGPLDSDRLPLSDPKGKALLLKLLAANNVVVIEPPTVRLSETFRAILPFRDLLEAKLAFAASVASDIGALLPELLDDLPAFMAKSKTFELFRYDRCLEVTPDNIMRTREWMRFTTALTRYEAQAFLDMADLAGTRRMMDLGGNSGEFVLQLCRRHSELNAVVFDLPVVAAIGSEHISGEPEAARIAFRAGDMRRDELPRDFDLVTFKSVLHDWPDSDALLLLAKAKDAVGPGGTLAVFERGPMTVPADGLPYWMLPNLAFFRFFRSPDFYADAMRSLGFADVQVQTIRLEMDFHVISGTRAS